MSRTIAVLLGAASIAMSLATLLVFSGSAAAQSWPAKPVRFILPVGGRLNMVLGSYTAVEAMTKAGKLRVIGISSPTRIATLPEVQSIAETLPGFFIGGTGVLVAPTGTPNEIIRRLNREIDPLVRDPAYVQRLNAGGTTINGAGTPESIAVYLKDLRELYGRIVRELKVQPE